MSFRIYVVATAAIVSGWATPSAGQECQLRYASQLAEAAATAQAEIKADALRSVAGQLEASLGDRTRATVALDARYSVTAAGGLAQEAYGETVDGFLCNLERSWTDQPEQVARLNRAHRDILLMLDEYFDPALWQIDALQLRTELRNRLRDAPAEPPLFPATAIATLPNPNFDEVRLRQISVSVEVPSVIEGKACAGMVRRSIRRVQPEVLASLSQIRPTLVKWLSGDRTSARLDLWRFASAQMSRQLTQSQTAVERLDVTPDFLACVQQARDAAVAEAAAAPKPPQQAVGTTDTPPTIIPPTTRLQ